MRAFVLAVILASLLLATTASAAIGSSVNASLVRQTPDPVQPGEAVELVFRFENFAGGSTGPLTVELLPAFPFTLGDEAVKSAGSLDARQIEDDGLVVKYSVKVSNDAGEGSSSIRLRYRIGSGSWVTIGPFGVDIKTQDALLAVASVTSPPQGMRSGSRANLSVVLKNYGRTLLKDVRATLNVDSIPFSPVGASNEQVVGRIAAGESAQVLFPLVVDADADATAYKTGLKLVFLDTQGIVYTKNATIGLLVNNPAEYVISVKESTVHTPSANGDVVISLANTGPSELRFLTVELLESSSYQVISTPQIYVGNLEPDDFETIEFTVRTGKSSSSVPLAVRLSFKDNFNQETVTVERVLLPLYSKGEAGKLGLLAGNTNILAVFFGAGIQVILLVFIIFMLVDCLKNNALPRYKKVLWTVLILTGMGAALYWFLARRKK
jgi:hypothetical protein